MKVEQLEKLRRPVPGRVTRMHANGFSLGLWALYVGSGLGVKMVDGKYRTNSASTLLPETVVGTSAGFTVADNSTEKVWAEFAVTGSEVAGMHVYVAALTTVDHGASVPANTFDIATDTDGDVFVELGTVVSLAGVITSITPPLNEIIELTFPLIPIYLIPAPGTDGDVLALDGGVPVWETPGAGCS